MSIFVPGWDAFPAKLSEFYAEYQLNTLTTLRPDGRPHVVPVGVTLDPVQHCAWIITRDGSRKVRNVEAADGAAHVAVCQVDGPRWSTIEGSATVLRDAASRDRAIELYAQRYRRQPTPDERRIAIRIEVDRIVHGAMLDD
ncbi:TIGR03618 family F420-dependent PPOX class oxidoreductase [Nocardioides dubius]|uniref:TIGR03618 family F420-dependent PPOX class oxidoreductase n=1 Tax=Nocardioides dubius TaxID=317019 RepID=A0ABP4EBW2_9ACTN